MILQYDWGTPLYDLSIDLRYKILREPLGLKFDKDSLEKETNCLHFGVFGECYNILACLYLVPEKEGLHLKQMAVDTPFQRKGLGKKLIDDVENTMLCLGFDSIFMHARKTAIGFYEKLGYTKIGEEFEEVGIPHYKMLKKITAKRI